MPVEKYLRTTYHPDRDYVEGEARERDFGEFEHSSAQRRILLALCRRYPAMEWRVLPEQRVQVKTVRYRVPDICVLADNAPRESVIRTPPAVCIEILSRDDSMSEIMERVEEYFDAGTPYCWIVDPIRRRAWIAVPGRLTKVRENGVLQAGDVELPLAEVLD